MESFLSDEVRVGLEQARKRAAKASKRLCVHVGNDVFRITQTFDNGFSVPADLDTDLRGLVDVYDGPKHLFQCLIVCAELSDDDVHYEYKRTTEAVDQAPVDFVRVEDAPIALLAR
jgi:hypothetical protein